MLSGKPFGVLTFATAESGRSYEQSDLALAEDLANRAAIAVENARLYRELREADRRKDEFLATLAHELRNPLAPIRNSLQILKVPRLEPATAERSRAMMERQVHHLVRLVDDLLDVSRVMRGKIELRTEVVDLAAVVARAIETTQPLIEAQGHELRVSFPSEPLPLEADPVRLATDPKGVHSATVASSGLTRVYTGNAVDALFGAPAGDSHAPDIVGIAQYGVVYTGGVKKIAEHGGDSPADRHVPLLVDIPGLTHPFTVSSTVQTTQIAPTILALLHLNPRDLTAVRRDGTAVLPGI